MSIIDIPKFTSKLKQNSDGLWVSVGARQVSYPPDGNDLCLKIEGNSFWFRHRNKVITTLVKSFIPNGPVFDIGAGNGYVSLALEHSGVETVVVEPGAQGARNAKTRGLGTIIHSALEDCEFQDQTIPAFGLFDVLEHVQDDSEFLKSLHRQLLPTGYVYVTVPAYNFLWSIEDDYAQHYRRYTVRTLKKTLESTGFAVRYCSYFFCLLVPGIFALRSLPSRLRMSGSIDIPSVEQEHAERAGITTFLLKHSLAYELRRIEKTKYLPTGSSCVAVAQKVPHG